LRKNGFVQTFCFDIVAFFRQRKHAFATKSPPGAKGLDRRQQAGTRPTEYAIENLGHNVAAVKKILRAALAIQPTFPVR
jgi:hypothetical protein